MSLERRPKQSARLLAFLRARAGQWVPLPEVLALGIAQYNARVFELRRDGHVIENRTETVGGQKRSWFRLVTRQQANLFDAA